MMGQQAKPCRCAIAPLGLTGMQHADGEILRRARRRKKFGIPFTLFDHDHLLASKTWPSTPPSAPFWFQLYVMRDREDFVDRLIDRRQGGAMFARWC